MIEKPVFFQRDGECLFGMLHLPATQPGRGAFLMSHPFGEEKLWSHRSSVSLARALAAQGFAVMRFDYTGAGDSSGESGNCSLSTYLADISAAFEVLAEQLPSVPIGLIGLRLGATVAALFAERAQSGSGAVERLKSAPLVLCDPVTDGESYLQELLRINLATQLAVYGAVREDRDALKARLMRGERVNVDGYEIGTEFQASLGTATLLGPDPKLHAGRTLVVGLAASEKQAVRPGLAELAGSYPHGELRRVIEAPFWRETKQFCARTDNLQREVIEWLGPAHA